MQTEKKHCNSRKTVIDTFEKLASLGSSLKNLYDLQGSPRRRDGFLRCEQNFCKLHKAVKMG